MVKLSSEEKIRRLEAQIEALKKGQDPYSRILFENNHFYVRKESRSRKSLFMKSSRAVRGRECKGSQVPDKDLEQWLSDAKEAVAYVIRMEEESEDQA